ncbi:hypothetical protein [Actinoalloteichus hymeniacidonis]|uniref:hypothetical protein n=1 Tax=Actinoalloteichus hymeniacidonis TaxID=340345 RepID=UPI0008532912|nr:hypothetical protein [Actinoalloteichus hymeniacidonis]MBB5910279.1 hypothetical protein [Actinoalloteichus hymeniacidonis]
MLYVLVSVVGIALLTLSLVLTLRGRPVVPKVEWRRCADCGHSRSEHSAKPARCRVAVGGSSDRYDGGGNWIGWWNETYCDCSGYRE